MTAKLCGMATSLQNTQFVKSARRDLQHNQAPRHHAPNVLAGKMSKDVVVARSATVYKLLIEIAFAGDGYSAQLRGHWAQDTLLALRRTPGGCLTAPANSPVVPTLMSGDHEEVWGIHAATA